MSNSRVRTATVLAVAVSVAVLVWDPGAPAADPKRAALLLLGLGAVALALVRTRGIKLSRAAWAWLALVGWSALSLCWGQAVGLRDVGTWVGGAALIVGSGLLDELERKRLVRTGAVLTGGAAALWAITQVIFGARGIFVHGGQGNGNWLGLLVAVSLPLAVDELACTWKSRSGWSRVALVSVVLQAGALVVSHSRVAWVAVAISLVAWAIASRASIAKCAATVAVAASLVVGIGWSSARAARSEAAENATAADVEVGTALQGRIWIWKSSAAVALDSLPLGTGMGRFAHRYLEVQGARLSKLEPKAANRKFENATTAHSDWIQLAAETGPVGLALFALAMFWALGSAFRARWLGGFVCLASLGVCAWGDSPLRQPAIVAMVSLLMAALPGQAQLQGAWFRRAAGAAWGGAALLLACSCSTWLSARWITASRSQPPEQAIVTLQRAERVDRAGGEAPFALGVAWLEAGDSEQAISALERSRIRLANVGTDIALGNARMRSSQIARAVDSYDRAIGLHPGSFRAHANLTEALRLTGRLTEASSHLAIAKTLWPGNPHLAELDERMRESLQQRDRETASMP